MPIERYKDMTIRGHKFRINRVTAQDGAWCVTQITNGRSGQREVYDKITAFLFNAVELLQNPGDGSDTPTRISRDGQFLNKALDLEYDLEFYDEVYRAAFKFNLSPFLNKLIQEAKEAEEEEKRKQITNQ